MSSPNQSGQPTEPGASRDQILRLAQFCLQLSQADPASRERALASGIGQSIIDGQRPSELFRAAGLSASDGTWLDENWNARGAAMTETIRGLSRQRGASHSNARTSGQRPSVTRQPTNNSVAQQQLAQVSAQLRAENPDLSEESHAELVRLAEHFQREFFSGSTKGAQ